MDVTWGAVGRKKEIAGGREWIEGGMILPRVIFQEFEMGGEYRQMFGGCKHAQSQIYL